MRDYFGTVLGIDRSTGTLRALINGVERTCSYDPRRLPWPLATAAFSLEGAGSFRCRGPVGDRRVLFHDDFLRVVSPSYGDTNWTGNYFGGAGTIAQGTNGVGSVLFTTPDGGQTDIAKDVSALAYPSGSSGLHFVARARHSVTSLNDAEGHTPIYIQATVLLGSHYNTSLASSGDQTHYVLRWVTPGAGVFSQVLNGSTLTTDFAVCEVVVAENYVAAWVDGDGPYFGTKASQTVWETGFPFAVNVSLAGGRQTTFETDYVTVATVNPVVHQDAVDLYDRSS